MRLDRDNSPDPPELEQVLSPGAVGESLLSPGSVHEELTEDAAVDEGDKLLYEWQFDILSSLPREKAIALVEHLRRSERDRAKAAAAALRLQRSNGNLERQLDTVVTLLRETDPSNPRLATLLTEECDGNGEDAPADGHTASSAGGWGQRLWRCIFGLLAVGVLLMPAAAFFLLASAPVIPPPETRPRDDAAFAVIPESLAHLPAQRAEDGHLQSELEDARRSLETCKAQLHQPAVSGSGNADSPEDPQAQGTPNLVRETTVREMTLRETKTVEYDKATVARLSKENEAMKGQLERLWLDIDLAIQRKQDMVCWNL